MGFLRLTSEVFVGFGPLPEGSGIHPHYGCLGRRCCVCAGDSSGTCVSSTTVLQSMKLGVDVNRHKEVIVKAISAVLLLLLKHFKLNHIYQVPVGSVCLRVHCACASVHTAP